MRQHFAFVPHKVGEQIEFGWRQVDFSSKHDCFSFFDIGWKPVASKRLATQTL